VRRIAGVEFVSRVMLEFWRAGGCCHNYVSRLSAGPDVLPGDQRRDRGIAHRQTGGKILLFAGCRKARRANSAAC
jgi:hypothetical protein